MLESDFLKNSSQTQIRTQFEFFLKPSERFPLDADDARFLNLYGVWKISEPSVRMKLQPEYN